MSGITERPSASTLGELAGTLNPEVAAVLDRALGGEDITAEEASLLFGTTGPDYNAMVLVADELRRRTVGDIVTYVVNRNINFTNVCIKRCGFCAFSRDFREEEGYFLPIEEIVRRAQEAWDYGATEVCIQAGLPPHRWRETSTSGCAPPSRKLFPDMHIHGFSPEEVLYGSIRSRCSIREYLEGLRDAGVGSLPGTSAEVLDQEMRDQISPGRITVDQWVEVITTAHELGHTHHIHGYVRTQRDAGAAVQPHGAPAGHTAADRRYYRVRAAEFRAYRSAHVPEEPDAQRAPGSHRDGRCQDARHRAHHAEQLDPQRAGIVGQGRLPDVPAAAYCRGQ